MTNVSVAVYIKREQQRRGEQKRREWWKGMMGRMGMRGKPAALKSASVVRRSVGRPTAGSILD
jgi:hypothetical protein